jgi:hypothetical protein
MLIGSRTTGGLISVSVLTGGTGYTSAPAVSFSGSGGATAVAVMAGTRVDSVIITNAGTGYTGNPTVTLSGGGGTGAAATAFAYTGPLRPMSFFQGRYGTVYGVDGMGRGIRWDGGSTSGPIGLHKPSAATIVANTTSPGKRVSSIQMVSGGVGYSSAPSVVLTGGSPTRPAVAQAAIQNGQVVGVRIMEPGAGYQSTPTVSFTGGLATGAAFTVGVAGEVDRIRIVATGSGYTGGATIDVASSYGLTGFVGEVQINPADGRVLGVNVISGGTGATSSPTFTIAGAYGSGAIVSPVMLYAVSSVSVASGGTGYLTPPFITLRPAASDTTGRGAEVEATVNNGSVASVTVLAGGQYSQPPTAVVINTAARAVASMADPLRGKYLCALRYIDDLPADVGGPRASSISHLVEVDTGSAQGSLEWAFSHPYLDAAVTAMELWRTSGDQSFVLFRVATIQRTDPNWATTYTDNLSDPDLTDPEREGFALMPITLPSGQINARRFEVPPGRFAVGVMFQDRAWYGVDTTGRAPNSLYYSEVDEPESVPEANELVIQENTGLPDRLVSLIPFGTMLLAVQSSHIYQVMYVSQPVIDASIMLVATRGALNSRCHAIMAGVVFLADSVGMYAFDGNQEQSISVAVDNYWTDRVIDFTKSDKFHVACDPLTRVVRFFYCRSTDDEPVRALCYCTATQAWWEESYATPVTATALPAVGGQLRLAYGGSNGVWRKESGTNDGGTGIPFAFRTPAMSLVNEPDRAIGVLYKPTTGDSNLNVSLHFNNSDTARPNAIFSDTGSGFTVTAGGPATINMKRTRSALGEATGAAVAHHSGRKSEKSSGGDQHLAVQVAGTQTSDPVTLYSLRVAGVQ